MDSPRPRSNVHFGWSNYFHEFMFHTLLTRHGYVVIDRLTIWEAAGHPTALRFLLAGAAIVLPFIAAYQILSYRIFRGKANAKLYD